MMLSTTHCFVIVTTNTGKQRYEQSNFEFVKSYSTKNGTTVELPKHKNDTCVREEIKQNYSNLKFL